MSTQEYTTISVDPVVRNNIKHLKRGEESYNELLQKMAEQYDPQKA